MGSDGILKNKYKRRRELKKYYKRKELDPKILKTLPDEIQKDTSLLKYWHSRYRLFKKFDQGIKLDKGKQKITIHYYTIFIFVTML
jgi:hypothetical protein